MKAVVFHGKKDIRVDNIPEPKIDRPTDVIIKVNLSTICGGDIHIKNIGLIEPGKVIGHEYCGVVVETGNQVVRFKKGDRVIGKPFFHCGHCFYCEHNEPELCENAAVFGTGITNGVQAEYARIPYADYTLKKIPEGMADEDVLLVADILSTGYTGLTRGSAAMGETIAVFGTGPIGLCSIMCAPFFGPAQVIAIDIVDYRLDFARKMGAMAINSLKEEPVAKIKALTGGRGADLSIEAAGFEPTFRMALQATRRGGRVNILGRFNKPTNFDVNERVDDSFTLSVGLGDLNHMDAILALIKAGKLNPISMITHRLPLAEALMGYDIFENKLENSIKVVFNC
jgi:alcohol dehydrogenase